MRTCSFEIIFANEISNAHLRKWKKKNYKKTSGRTNLSFLVPATSSRMYRRLFHWSSRVYIVMMQYIKVVDTTILGYGSNFGATSEDPIKFTKEILCKTSSLTFHSNMQVGNVEGRLA